MFIYYIIILPILFISAVDEEFRLKMAIDKMYRYAEAYNWWNEKHKEFKKYLEDLEREAPEVFVEFDIRNRMLEKNPENTVSYCYEFYCAPFTKEMLDGLL
jgi:hypothetical protein